MAVADLFKFQKNLNSIFVLHVFFHGYLFVFMNQIQYNIFCGTQPKWAGENSSFFLYMSYCLNKHNRLKLNIFFTSKSTVCGVL